MSIESQDDQVLAQLYKEGAKETPSPELDQKILDYAANKNKSAHGSSLFGGGWKVPLSLAASVVLVFTILVQLDQSPEQLEIPSIPTSDKSDNLSVPMDEKRIGDFNEPDLGLSVPAQDILNRASKSLDQVESDTSAATTENKLESRKKFEQQETMPRSESSLEKSRQFDDFKMNNELEMEQTPGYAPDGSPTFASPSAKQKASSAPTPETTRATESLEPMQNSPLNTTGASTSMSFEESMNDESNKEQEAQEPGRQDRDNALMADEEAGFAPMPVEDWLLMIEQLVARKDYAEAARQLEKFKQAHPKINVEDLESKIP